MSGFTSMNGFTGRESRCGFYSVEAAVFLPLVILAVLTIGYFIRTDSVWENTMHCALDECSYSAATCSSGPLGTAVHKRALQRISRDSPQVSGPDVNGTGAGSIYTCVVHGAVSTSLPLGFSRDYELEGRIMYRDFTGLKHTQDGMGSEGLETPEVSNPVWVFPQSGTKYHTENCSYVRAAVHSCILTESLRRRYSSCELCDSGDLPLGSVVFCFSGKDTAYHRGRCGSIKKHTIVMDRSEAVKKGYRPCSRCGG